MKGITKQRLFLKNSGDQRDGNSKTLPHPRELLSLLTFELIDPVHIDQFYPELRHNKIYHRKDDLDNMNLIDYEDIRHSPSNQPFQSKGYSKTGERIIFSFSDVFYYSCDVFTKHYSYHFSEYIDILFPVHKKNNYYICTDKEKVYYAYCEHAIDIMIIQKKGQYCRQATLLYVEKGHTGNVIIKILEGEE